MPCCASWKVQGCVMPELSEPTHVFMILHASQNTRTLHFQTHPVLAPRSKTCIPGEVHAGGGNSAEDVSRILERQCITPIQPTTRMVQSMRCVTTAEHIEQSQSAECPTSRRGTSVQPLIFLGRYSDGCCTELGVSYKLGTFRMHNTTQGYMLKS